MKVDKQQPSTQAILDRPVEEDKNHMMRALPTYDSQPEEIIKAYLKQNWSSFEREIKPDEFTLVDGMRKSSRNTSGQSLKEGASPETKAFAAECFMFSGPANLGPTDRDRITYMQALNAIMASEPAPKKEHMIKWIEMKWYQAIWHWIKGGDVKKEETKKSWRDL